MNIGDTVRLKSGGPPMTVTDMFAGNNMGDMVFICAWFHKGEHHLGNFPDRAVELALPDGVRKLSREEPPF